MFRDAQLRYGEVVSSKGGGKVDLKGGRRLSQCPGGRGSTLAEWPSPYEDCFVAGPTYILWSKVVDSQVPPTHCVVRLHRGSGNLTRLLMMSVRMICLLLTLVAGVQLQSDLRHGEGLFTTSTTIRFLYPLWIYSLNWKMA